MTNIAATITRLSSQPGVVGVLVATQDGAIIRSTMGQEESTKYAAIVAHLTQKASALMAELATPAAPGAPGAAGVTGSKGSPLRFVRIRSEKHEIMIAPDSGYLLVVVQTPAVSTGTA